MGGINLFGLVLVAVGGMLVFLGVSGRYQVFTGATSGTTSSTSAATAAANTNAEQTAIGEGIAVGSNGIINAPGGKDVASAIGSGIQTGIFNSSFFV